jgi:hypothetical protein
VTGPACRTANRNSYRPFAILILGGGTGLAAFAFVLALLASEAIARFSTAALDISSGALGI